MSKKEMCGGCYRFKGNSNHPQRYNCSCHKREDNEVFETAIACDIYWNKAEQYEQDRIRDEEIENKRKQMWEKYSNNPPVKLPIVNDGYGMIPMCPTCGEMPYSTERCHWCGQRFIQDEEVKEYTKPNIVEIKCPSCGGTMVGTKSKYNGHFHGECKQCGCRIMQ